MNIRHSLQKLSEMLFQIKVTPLQWAAVFAGIVALRVFIEKLAQKFPNDSINYTTTFYIQNLFFFLLTFLLIWLWLSFILKTNPSKLTNILLWGSWLIILPPIIDIIWTGGKVYWSFYLLNNLQGLWSQFYTVFGNLPPAIVYFGTKITIILAVILLSLYVYSKTKSAIKTFLNVIVIYCIFFFMASFPSWFSFIYYPLAEWKNILSVNNLDAVSLFATPAKIFSLEQSSIISALSYKLNIIYFLLIIFSLIILFRMINKEQLKFFSGNFLRLSSIIFTALLFFIGLALGYQSFPENFNLNIFSIFAVFSLLLSLFFISTIREYAENNKTLEGKRDHKDVMIIIFLLSLAGGIIVSFKFFVLLLIINIISAQYFFISTRRPLINLISIFVTALVILTMGYILISDFQTIQNLPWLVGILIITGYTVISYFADSKNINRQKQVASSG